VNGWNHYKKTTNHYSPLGGSSIEVALGKYWNQQGLITSKTDWQAIEKVSPLLVVSGSCSPITAAQIAYAKANGFIEVVMDTIAIANDGIVSEQILQEATQLLQQQKNVIVHTGRSGSRITFLLKN
jgi:uncharacterized protein YgbK (DUF1537 family)